MSKSKLLVTWVASHSCDHCEDYKEEWEELCSRYEGSDVEFTTVYIDDDPDFIQEHDIENVPCFLFSRRGRYYDICVVGPDTVGIMTRIQELLRC